MFTFVIISTCLSVGILFIMFKLAEKRESTLQRKYEQLVVLRQLIALSRQHRSATHLGLTSQHNPDGTLQQLNDLLAERSNYLISISNMDAKPTYRILQMKLAGLEKQWRERTIAKNQIAHGSAIRHCMFLMDEVAMAWLAESGRLDLSDQYHMNWQQVLDSMEALTQLRISIQDMHTQSGRLRTQYRCTTIRRKLNQLALISPYSIASPSCSRAMHILEEMVDNSNYLISSEQLYTLTSDISLSITNVYDHILSELTEDLYLPLPQLEASTQ